MIKHVVFCRFKPEVSSEEREEIVAQLKRMPEEIGAIRDLQVGLDVLRSGRSWDFALVASFDDLAGLTEYSDHPAHVPLKAKMASVSDQLGVVDFES